MSRHQVLPLVATTVVLAVAGCGGGDGEPPAATPPRDEAAAAPLAKAARAPGELVFRADASPSEFGPVTLDGRYVVRFQQIAPEDPQLDFSRETPFIARLEPLDRRGRSVKLVRSAAAEGRTTVRADGRWRVVVDFGDYPYVLRLTPHR